ncbi:hypothetical protein HMPREF1548_02345 [Clostridium sp. KLE 1755]|nr:hypothetical protein HMPREF1548_02345 [Clostridium sp. KLE 1755]
MPFCVYVYCFAGVFWRVLQGFRNWIGQGREFCLVRRKELVSDG